MKERPQILRQHVRTFHRRVVAPVWIVRPVHDVRVVAVEDPGYPRARIVFQALGCTVHGVPVDREGLVVEALPPETRLVYVCPSHQFPLGMSMSLPRRLAQLAWANRSNAAIVEDDYD